MAHTLYWNLLLKMFNKYRDAAEKSLGSGSYIAGLVLVRAALETLLKASFVIDLFDWSDEELKEYGIKINRQLEIIENITFPHLKKLIDEAYKAKLIKETGHKAAHRIREWGNKIHVERVVEKKHLPRIGKRNLKARLNDLDLVADQLLNTI